MSMAARLLLWTAVIQRPRTPVTLWDNLISHETGPRLRRLRGFYFFWREGAFCALQMATRACCQIQSDPMEGLGSLGLLVVLWGVSLNFPFRRILLTKVSWEASSLLGKLRSVSDPRPWLFPKSCDAPMHQHSSPFRDGAGPWHRGPKGPSPSWLLKSHPPC